MTTSPQELSRARRLHADRAAGRHPGGRASSLAAIALSAVTGQRAKAQDGAAKADARTVVLALGTCYTEAGSYNPCPDPSPGPPLGSGRGEIDVTPAGDAYVVVAHSPNGKTFTVTKLADHTLDRACSDAGSPRGGCVGGEW